MGSLPQRTPPTVTNDGLYIGGEWVPAASGQRIDSIDPATEQVIGSVPAGGAEDVGRAVAAAQEIYPEWRALPPLVRAKALRQFAERLAQNEQELAELDARDSGNPVEAMRDDVRSAVGEIEMFAGLATELRGSTAQNGSAQFSYSLREPYGVVGRIIPFNHPLKFAAIKVAAPLLAGNAVVLKPSEAAPLSALRMAELAHGVFPPGVLNVVTGYGSEVGAALAAHPRVRRVGFTGSLRAGAAVLRAGADLIKHVSLELGGKNPMIVFPDVDVDEAAGAAVAGMNFARSQGQSCMSTSRVFVHRDIRGAFVDAMAARMQALKVGDPLDSGTDLGPLAFREHFERVLGYIETGKREGATLVTGGDQPIKPGFFVSPTLFADVKNDMTIAQEEIFGPVVAVVEWSDVDHVVEQANDTIYGLTANIWTNDLRLAHRVAHRVESGYVWINGKGKRVPGTPFGGYKRSGVGRDSSLEEVLSYTQEKVIAVGL